MQPVLYKYTGTPCASYGSRRQAVTSSIRLSRARCTRYTSRLEVQVFTNYYQVRQRLTIAHNLRKDKKKKPILYTEDEFELLKTLYTSIETTFPHERYRVQLALIIQLTGITGNRPSTLLAVRYQNIKVTLLKDPNGGEQPQVLIEIVFNHTKGYLGEKDAYVFKFHIIFAVISRCVAVANQRGRKEFGIPNVPNEPYLLLCPHVIILALLFTDQAFAASSLTLAEQLFCLRITPGQK